jgi:hypothetical protein
LFSPSKLLIATFSFSPTVEFTQVYLALFQKRRIGKTALFCVIVKF